MVAVAYERYQMQCFDCKTKQAFGKWSLKRGNRLREVVAQRGSTVYIYILNSIIYFTVDSDWLLNYVFFSFCRGSSSPENTLAICSLKIAAIIFSTASYSSILTQSPVSFSEWEFSIQQCGVFN